MNNSTALSYLRSLFNPDLGLCYEAPLSVNFRNSFWTNNDNKLAARAFDRLGDSESSSAIMQTLQSISVFGHNGFRNNGYADPFVFQPDLLPAPVKVSQCYHIDKTGKILDAPVVCSAGPAKGSDEIWHEEANGPNVSVETPYFDYCASRALSWHKQNRPDLRDSLIARLETQWDTVNQAFKHWITDSPDLQKPTYYHALYVLLGEKTGWPSSFVFDHKQRVLDLLDQLQCPNGGFSTGFTLANGQIQWSQDTDTLGNCETHCWVVMSKIRPTDY